MAGAGQEGDDKDAGVHKTLDMQAVKVSLDAYSIWKKQAAAATALGNFAQVSFLSDSTCVLRHVMHIFKTKRADQACISSKQLGLQC